MLASDLSLAAPPLASRYEAMWGCDDVEFPASIAYLQEFEHPQAEGIEPHHTIRACRRAEDRKRATDHMVGPRTISRAEADVLCKLKLLGYFADGGKCFADYTVRDVKLPAHRPDCGLLVPGRPRGNWGFDVAYIYGSRKDVWGFELRLAIQQNPGGGRGRHVTPRTWTGLRCTHFGVSTLASTSPKSSTAAGCSIGVSIIQKSKCLVVDLLGAKFSLCTTVRRDVVSFSYCASYAYNKVRLAHGRGGRGEMTGNTSASDAPSVAAELVTQSTPKKVAMGIPGRVVARLVFIRRNGG